MEQEVINQNKVVREYKIPADDHLAIGIPVKWLRNRDRRIKTVQLIIASNGDLMVRKKANNE